MKITRIFARGERIAVAAIVALLSTGGSAFAQMTQAEFMTMNQSDPIIELAINLILGIAIIIGLLLARQNMNGWRQPVKWVWFSFQGRLNRKAYWLKGVLLLALAQFAFGIIMALFGFVASVLNSPEFAGIISIGILVVMIPYVGLIIWASLGMTIKRLHDVDKSGWFMLLGLVPILNLWPAILVAFIKGTEGANRFGFDPLDGVDPAGADDGEGAHHHHHQAHKAAATGGFGHGAHRPAPPMDDGNAGPAHAEIHMGADGNPSMTTVRERLGEHFIADDEPGRGTPEGERE